MKKTNSQKGITLVALIITIIVLLILAVVAIRAVQGDNIIAHAENARDKYNEAQVNEQTILDSYSDKLKEDKSAETIAEAQKDSMVNKTVNSTVTDIYGNKVVVPAGFKILVDNTTGYTKDNLDVTKGIVIQDKDGNEFVWIPVGTINHLDKDGKETTTTIDLKRYVFKSDGTIDTNLTKTEPGDQLKISSIITDYYTEGLKDSNTSNAHAKDIEAFKISANTNCGYYLGRYEAGKLNNVLVCKSNQVVYCYITQLEASSLSQNMYKDATTFESDLINSYAWDTAIMFIQTFSTESDASTYSQLNKSTGFRNTGVNPDKYCNIHDMSGNACEFSTESYNISDNNFVDRGGFYRTTDDSANLKTNTRGTGKTTIKSSWNSFRPLLYL